MFEYVKLYKFVTDWSENEADRTGWVIEVPNHQRALMTFANGKDEVLSVSELRARLKANQRQEPWKSYISAFLHDSVYQPSIQDELSKQFKAAQVQQ